MKVVDVIVSVTGRFAVFEPQNRKAAECLGELCEHRFENVHDQVVVDSDRKPYLVTRLMTAGFSVLG